MQKSRGKASKKNKISLKKLFYKDLLKTKENFEYLINK